MTAVPVLSELHLDTSSHSTRDDGVCLLEAVAWFAGEKHTDRPSCVSPVLRDFGISLNDRFPDDKRQLLVPLIPELVGTAGDGHDEARGYLALDWLVRMFTPAWLELAGLAESAAELRGLRRIVDLTAADAAGPVVRASGVKAAAARAAARAAAGDAARAATGDAAGAAAGAAARAAAGDAAGAAAGAAARAAAGDAARDAARAAARAAAGDAAGDAAGAAARDAARAAARAAARDAARDAAWDAARDALRPTVDGLQLSAIDLFSSMIRVGR
jgi:hypothetical protein